MTTVYITGGSAGLGRAIAAAYAKDGYKVGIIAREPEALAEAAADIGHGVVCAAADVSVFEQLEAAAQKLEALIGPPDIWINDAMATIFSRFEDITPAEFAQSTNITFLGSVYGTQIALKFMKARGKGHIIQVGSALAYRAIPLQAPYCASKYALRGALESLRCELIHDKSPINVTMVQMPAMNTPQFDWARRHIAEQPQPAPPIYAPEACARAVLWAAKHPTRREVWVGKPTFQAILANKLVPGIMDYYMAHRAFEGQFEYKTEDKNTEGNLFAPLKKFHHTEGHFANRQSNKVLWVGTSWRHETVLFSVLFLLFLAFVAALVIGWSR
jgi:NAD(P)-dependent dehydrogenase (short-subunit alcohol dehydrogenase family)